MKKLSEIDKNFEVRTKINKDDIVFYDADNRPFKLYGIFRENGVYRRMPEPVAVKVNEMVKQLHTNTAGGRVRFATDSPYIAINAIMSEPNRAPHFSLTGAAGFDMYVKENGEDKYSATFVPPYEIESGFESVKDFFDASMREITINFPNYSNVERLFIGVSQNAKVLPAPEYKIEKPIVYYGSSITQGGCASRPGNAYQAIVSRNLSCNFINLGFSSGARGEDIMIDYIKSLDMSAFVMDYDYNAPTAEHLMATHEKMYKTIRNAKPGLPVIMMPRPKYDLEESAEEPRRAAIVKATYDKAVSEGDKNVYYISGKELVGEGIADNGTVDGCHPTDLGFYAMARAVGEVLERILR